MNSKREIERKQEEEENRIRKLPFLFPPQFLFEGRTSKDVQSHDICWQGEWEKLVDMRIFTAKWSRNYQQFKRGCPNRISKISLSLCVVVILQSNELAWKLWVASLSPLCPPRSLFLSFPLPSSPICVMSLSVSWPCGHTLRSRVKQQIQRHRKSLFIVADEKLIILIFARGRNEEWTEYWRGSSMGRQWAPPRVISSPLVGSGKATRLLSPLSLLHTHTHSLAHLPSSYSESLAKHLRGLLSRDWDVGFREAEVGTNARTNDYYSAFTFTGGHPHRVGPCSRGPCT